MKRAIFNLCLLALTGVLFIGCSNSLEDDEANLAIVWGDAGKFVSAGELPGFRYDVVLRCEGLTLRHSFIGVPAAKFKVIPGVWSITVKGYDREMNLKVMGIEQVKIGAGKNETKVMNIYTASEVGSWVELNDAINLSGNSAAFTSSNPRTELLLISKSFSTKPVGGSTHTIDIPRPIILVAENDITIERSSPNDAFFGIRGAFSASRLTLGLDGMTGTITLDGKSISASRPLITVAYNNMSSTSGSLILNNGVTIKGNTNTSASPPFGGGVSVDEDGTFIMNGGIISGNTANDDNGSGGAYVRTGGTFIQLGGIISGNKPNDVVRE